jgi:hypothetical protein
VKFQRCRSCAFLNDPLYFDETGKFKTES